MLRQRIIRVFVAATEWKWTRVVTALALLITTIAVTGCKHPH